MTLLESRVKGSVQGVGYRYYCKDAAKERGLKGYVMNLASGDVELEVFGDDGVIKEFIEEITRKDRMFEVMAIKMDEIPVNASYKDFGIKFGA